MFHILHHSCQLVKNENQVERGSSLSLTYLIRQDLQDFEDFVLSFNLSGLQPIEAYDPWEESLKTKSLREKESGKQVTIVHGF